MAPRRPRADSDAEAPGRTRVPRLMVVTLPHLAAEVLTRDHGLDPAAPVAAVAGRGGALVLASVNGAAAARGLAPGLGLSDARALCPDLATRTMTPARQARFLAALVRWAGRYSPLVGTEAETALVLDITGCAGLFGGERAMGTEMVAALAARGLTARIGIADTKGAAWALAGGARPLTLASPGGTRAAIGALPVAALRLDPAAAEGLAALGLTTIDLMSRVPRGQIARRFGLAALRRLDQALGLEPEPVTPVRAACEIDAQLSLAEPVGRVADVAAGLGLLLPQVCAALAEAGLGARGLALHLARVDGAAAVVRIALARPMRDPARLAALFAPKLATVEAGFGIDALRLVAESVAALPPEQVSAEAGRRPRDPAAMTTALADLISQLGNRLGFDAVTRLLPTESHVPERAFSIAAAAWSEAGIWTRQGPARPVRLIRPDLVVPLAPGAPPARLRWRGRDFAVLWAEGPERIAPEWWWDDPAWATGLRDYWRVGTAEGPRLWLFHTPAAPRPDWFVHGEFA